MKRVSNSDSSEGRIMTAITTMAVHEPYNKQVLHPISCESFCEFGQIISNLLYVRLNGTC